MFCLSLQHRRKQIRQLLGLVHNIIQFNVQGKLILAVNSLHHRPQESQPRHPALVPPRQQ